MRGSVLSKDTFRKSRSPVSTTISASRNLVDMSIKCELN